MGSNSKSYTGFINFKEKKKNKNKIVNHYVAGVTHIPLLKGN